MIGDEILLLGVGVLPAVYVYLACHSFRKRKDAHGALSAALAGASIGLWVIQVLRVAQ